MERREIAAQLSTAASLEALAEESLKSKRRTIPDPYLVPVLLAGGSRG